MHTEESQSMCVVIDWEIWSVALPYGHVVLTRAVKSSKSQSYSLLYVTKTPLYRFAQCTHPALLSSTQMWEHLS